jgi:hypothetical protein
MMTSRPRVPRNDLLPTLAPAPRSPKIDCNRAGSCERPTPEYDAVADAPAAILTQYPPTECAVMAQGACRMFWLTRKKVGGVVFLLQRCEPIVVFARP